LPTDIIHHEHRMPDGKLDSYLTSGWRPAGQAVYTADFLRADDEELYGCIQVRLPLTNFKFKKRHRKMLRRNGERFRHAIHPAGYPDEQMRALNRRYMAVNGERSREDLELHVTGEFGWRVFNTHVVKVYDGDKLVAFSYFDLGVRTAYSKTGIYDPEYARFSLGIYTMALEIRWLLEREIGFYHPGYVVPRYPLFDYKIQFGSMEFRQIHTGDWLPYDHADQEDPYLIYHDALTRLQQATRPGVFADEVLEYPAFTGRFHATDTERELLDGALLLEVRGDFFPPHRVVTYDLAARKYELHTVAESHLRDTRALYFSKSGKPRRVEVLEIITREAKGEIGDILKALGVPAIPNCS